MFPRRTLAIAAAGAIAFTGLGIAQAATYYSWSQLAGGGPSGVGYFAWSVQSLALSANDDTLYVAGSFSSLTNQGGGSIQSRNVAQWRASDNTWVAMGKGVGSEAYAVAASPRGSVYVGGLFQEATQRTDDTIAAKMVVRWRSSDDTWLPMGRGISPTACIGGGSTCVVNALAVAASDDTVYVGGSFSKVVQSAGAEVTVNGIARWRSSDDTWLAMGKGVAGGGNPMVWAVAAAGDDTVFVGGSFQRVTQRTDDTVVSAAIAQWRASDDTWIPMGGGLSRTGGDPQVYDIAIAGNEVYVTGKFNFTCNNASCSSANAASGVAAWNMTTGAWVAIPFLPAAGTSIVAVLPRLLVQGQTSGGVSALWELNGGTWSVVASMTPGGGEWGLNRPEPYALAADDTYLYAGGQFGTIASVGGPSLSIANIARGVPGVAPNPDPTPTPVYPPDAPADVVASAGVEEASVSWKAPVYVGSFPITDYQVTSSPGSKSCLVKAPALSCTVSGLTAGTSYTFTARALNGAGWGAYSQPSNAVTPTAPVRPSIVITGSRDVADSGRIQVSGTSTGLVGERVTPFVRFPGQPNPSEGTGVQTVAADGTFAWGRKTGKKTYVYFQHGTTRSNTVVIPAR